MKNIIIKTDCYQKPFVYAETKTMEQAKELFNEFITSFEEGLSGKDLPVVRTLENDNYYVEWENGEWASIEIVEA